MNCVVQRIRRSVLPFAVTLLLPTLAYSVPLQIGRNYRGPTRLEIRQLSASFKLARGWTGQVGAEGMVMGHSVIPGVILGTVRPKASVADVVAELGKPITLDAATVLVPRGRPKVKGQRIVARYKNESAVGYAVVRRHPSGRTVAFIGAAKPGKLGPIRKAVDKLAASVKFAKIRSGGFWKKELSGVTLRKYNTSSGSGSSYTAQQRIGFCPNGRYDYYQSSSGFSVGGGAGVSHAARSGEQGNWRVSGSAGAGRLVLTDDDGGTTTFELQMRDGRLFVEGERWLRDHRQPPDC